MGRIHSMDTSVGTISYTDQGSGPPILLLHATLHDRSDFAPVYEALAEGRRILAIDWPGHGTSPPPHDPDHTGAFEFGTVAEEFVDRLDLRNLVVVGNSIGGQVACRLAITRGDRIAGLVVVNGSGFIRYNIFTRAFCVLMGRPRVIRGLSPLFARAYMAPQTAEDREILRKVAARVRTADGARTAAALWRSFPAAPNDLRDRAATITAPTLVTWGERDLTSPVRWGRAVHRAITGSRLVAMPTGHVVFSSAPGAWLGLVLPFAEEVQRAHFSPPR